MNSWAAAPVVSQVAAGDYTRSDLQVDTIPEDLLAELGRRTIRAYLEPISSHIDLFPPGVFDPRRYARRLFDQDGRPKPAFIQFAGEVLAAWYDESFSGRTCGRGPIPFDATPAFDSVAYEQQGDTVIVYLIQAKTTANHPTSNANLAARNFGRLEEGDYDHELSQALKEVASAFPGAAQRQSVMSALFEIHKRRACITTMFGCEPPTTVLTRYDVHVAGETRRRTASFIRLPDWSDAWDIVGAAAYAEISH